MVMIIKIYIVQILKNIAHPTSGAMNSKAYHTNTLQTNDNLRKEWGQVDKDQERGSRKVV